MTSVPLLARVACLLVCLASPFGAQAVWVCHGPNDTTWQQENPPCVAPAPEAVMRGSRTAQNESDRVIVPRRDVQFNEPPAVRPPPEPRSASARPGTRPSQGAYAIALADFERRYPSINPDSPLFNPDAVGRVKDLADKNRGLGMDSVTALQVAMRDTFHPQPVQPTPQPVRRAQSDASELVNAGVGGAIGGLGVMLGALVFVKLCSLLWRASRSAARKASEVIEGTSAVDMARAAGGVAGKAHRRAANLADAFRKGHRDRR